MAKKQTEAVGWKATSQLLTDPYRAGDRADHLAQTIEKDYRVPMAYGSRVKLQAYLFYRALHINHHANRLN